MASLQGGCILVVMLMLRSLHPAGFLSPVMFIEMNSDRLLEIYVALYYVEY